jgi:glutamate racemase
VREYALECLDRLVDDGVKLLVIACNTASAAMLRDARERYDVPVVEVIQPAVRRAVLATRNGRVGVIGTTATITSGAYEDAFAAAAHVEVTAAACPRFVDFVERGSTSGRQLLGLAQSYLEPLLEADVDTLVLGGLERDESLPDPDHVFLATGDPDRFTTLARRFLGPEVGHVRQATPV